MATAQTFVPTADERAIRIAATVERAHVIAAALLTAKLRAVFAATRRAVGLPVGLREHDAYRSAMDDHDDSRPNAVPEPRRMGRPRISGGEEMTAVSTWLPVSADHRLFRLASARRTTVAGTIRDLLRRRLL